ncbi:hypothetical protein [Halalkalicoccus ordinarius]|uniref:hypothetical protein n=1 Tax=Halalkalicoccus ordinarius TaxID=3116651 RepID=UPI00300F7417
MDFDEIECEHKDSPFDSSGFLDLNNPRFNEGETIKKSDLRKKEEEEQEEENESENMTNSDLTEEQKEKYEERQKRVKEIRENSLPDSTPNLNVSESNGGYGRDKGEHWEEWSNFTLEYKSIVTTPNDEKKMNFVVHPRMDESPFEVTVDTGVFHDKRKFKREVCVGETTVWKGSDGNLADLRQYITKQDRVEKKGTHHLGLNDGVWVTPNRNLTADGWSEEEEILYDARNIATERAWSCPDKFDREKVAEIIELLPRTRDTERLLPVIGFFYASSVKPYILDWEGEFNLLSVTGDTGAGKTATLGVLWDMFGMGKRPLTIKDGDFNEKVALSSTNSIPIWFDEYKPSDMQDYKVNNFHDKLRKTTRPSLIMSGNKDGSNDSYELEAPVVVSGEESISGAAEERRQIAVAFKSSSTETGSDTNRAFSELTGTSHRGNGNVAHYSGYDLSQHVVAWLKFLLNHDKGFLRQRWEESGEKTWELIQENDIQLPDEMDIQGMQTIHFGCTLYQKFADALDAELTFTDEDVEKAMLYSVTGANGGENRARHVDTLFDIASRAASDNMLKPEVHYKVASENELRINLSKSLDKIRKYAREHDLSEDILGSVEDYYGRMRDGPEKYPYIGLYDGEPKKKERDIGWSIFIDIGKAEREIENFRGDDFRHRIVDVEEEEEATNQKGKSF